MNSYGIKGREESFNFEYDKYYKDISLKLREIKNEAELNKKRIEYRENLSKNINVEIDFKILKENFINLLKDENSSKYLWILYSKYIKKENYIDKISDVLKKENKVFRAGINLYKLNGWMTHSLYVYQITNFNIAQNVNLSNAEKNEKIGEYINNLNIIYKNLSNAGKFLLKIISLVHDIGVIEDVAYHDKVGYKYVDKVLTEIGINDENLKELDITYNDLKTIVEQVIIYHTIMALLSGENSDKCVETNLKEMLSKIPEIKVKKEIAKIMYIFTFSDIIAVNEILMTEEKFQRLNNAYVFFEEIIENKTHNRDKVKVATERICDMCGKNYFEVSNKIDEILEKFKIDKTQFMKDMYNIKWFHYTGPLMKTVNDLEISIHVFYSITELIKAVTSEKCLEEFIVTFEPSKPTIEYDFIEVFKNGDFFKCTQLAKEIKQKKTIYNNICINRTEDKLGKHLSISIL